MQHEETLRTNIDTFDARGDTHRVGVGDGALGVWRFGSLGELEVGVWTAEVAGGAGR